MKFIKSILADSEQELRYLVMRTLRLAIMLPLEVGGMWLIIVGLWSALLGMSHWGADPAVNAQMYGYTPGTVMYAINFHPLAIFLGGVAIGIVCLCLSWAVGIPYRFKTAMPGINVKTCWKCGVGMVDSWFCQKCGAFRPAKVVTTLVWSLSLALTLVLIVHDVAWSMLTLGAYRGN